MCYVIEAEYIMAKYLQKKNNLSFRILNSISRDIQSNTNSVYVNITKNSIFTAIEINPFMFEWKNNEIIKPEKSSKYYMDEFTDNLLLEPIPVNIETIVKEIIDIYAR